MKPNLSKETIKSKESYLYDILGYKAVFFADANDKNQMLENELAYQEILTAVEQSVKYVSYGYRLN